MKYREITPSPFQLPASHPVFAEIAIDPSVWHGFQRLFADDPATRILGHDAPQNGKMVVYVACASRETRQRLEDGWG
jgi:hypothetical protein